MLATNSKVAPALLASPIRSPGSSGAVPTGMVQTSKASSAGMMRRMRRSRKARIENDPSAISRTRMPVIRSPERTKTRRRRASRAAAIEATDGRSPPTALRWPGYRRCAGDKPWSGRVARACHADRVGRLRTRGRRDRPADLARTKGTLSSQDQILLHPVHSNTAETCIGQPMASSRLAVPTRKPCLRPDILDGPVRLQGPTDWFDHCARRNPWLPCGTPAATREGK